MCTVVLRNHEGIVRHARLAREVGATWEEVLGSIMLTTPGFGMLCAVEAMPHARRGFDAAPRTRSRLTADAMSPDAELPFRILPEVTDRNRFFWTGGEQNELRFLRCDDCRYYIHPPTPICPTATRRR